MMIRYEYGELYKDKNGCYCFDGSVLSKSKWSILDFVEALNYLGEDGWEFVMKYKDSINGEVFVMKRIKQ